MRKYNLFSGFSTLENLESRLSLSSFSVGAVAAAVSTFNPQGPSHVLAPPTGTASGP